MSSSRDDLAGLLARSTGSLDQAYWIVDRIEQAGWGPTAANDTENHEGSGEIETRIDDFVVKLSKAMDNLPERTLTDVQHEAIAAAVEASTDLTYGQYIQLISGQATIITLKAAKGLDIA